MSFKESGKRGLKDAYWQSVTVDGFMNLLDGYLRWYREERLKSDLGYMSPKQYRLSLGLAA